MSQTVDNPTTTTEAPSETDVVAAVQRVLEASPEPLTVSKIRSQLPARFRTENLDDVLKRQVAASVFHQYPKYRSPQDRFWDRPMAVHVVSLLHETLSERPLAVSELRRKLPAYAQNQAESALQEQLAQGRLYRHPRTGRGGERYSARPPDPKDYLREEFIEVFRRLEQLGFSQEQLRQGALELLHEDEWATPKTPPAAQDSQPQQQAAPAAMPAAAAVPPGHERPQPMNPQA